MIPPYFSDRRTHNVVVKEERIVCVYCRTDSLRPAAGEHIVQAGLGGRKCLPDVCTVCNTGVLQKLDEAFLRNSPIALARVFLSHRCDLKLPVFVPSAEFGGWLDCRILPAQGAQTFSQVVLRDGVLVTVICEGAEAATRALLSTLEKNGIEAVHVDLHPRVANAPTRLVLRPKLGKSKASFTLRAQTQAEVDRFIALFKQAPFAPERAENWRSVNLGLGMAKAQVLSDVNVPGRAAATIAFNLMAHHLGAAVALGREFDPIRGYILGTNVLPVREVVTPTGEVGFTIDERFVGPWAGRALPPRRQWSAVADGHTVILSCAGREMRGLVHLFAGRTTFAVKLGTLAPGVTVRGPLPLFFCTPANGSGDEELDVHDVVARLGLIRSSMHRIGPSVRDGLR